MKFPTLYYFMDLKLDTSYLEAIRDIGYTPDLMRVVPIITPADIYSMKDKGDSRAWLEDYVHGDQGEEQVRIVQASANPPDYCGPPKIYSICILEGTEVVNRDKLFNFNEIWVSTEAARDVLCMFRVPTVVEKVAPEDVKTMFDPLSLVS